MSTTFPSEDLLLSIIIPIYSEISTISSLHQTPEANRPKWDIRKQTMNSMISLVP